MLPAAVAGPGLVNGHAAIGRLRVTQPDADLVGQRAAAPHGLRGSSEDLARAVEAFRLDDMLVGIETPLNR